MLWFISRNSLVFPERQFSLMLSPCWPQKGRLSLFRPHDMMTLFHFQGFGGGCAFRELATVERASEQHIDNTEKLCGRVEEARSCVTTTPLFICSTDVYGLSQSGCRGVEELHSRAAAIAGKALQFCRLAGYALWRIRCAPC
uniref:Bm11915 n=1 Tax=Brugia malayi TaxID=6279 RepID=A0A1I9GAE5_BRUMA|nr:Bm11915 [Brugia malayi]